MPLQTAKRATAERGRFGLCPALVAPRRSPDCCLRPEIPPKRPDPGLYSQKERFSQGLPLSWDNPDITTNLAGGIDPTVGVKVRNYANDCTAANVLVRLDYSPFGIGFARTALGAKAVNLAKAGQPGDTQNLTFVIAPSVRDEWRNLAVFVTVQHATDRNPQNNEAEQAWSAAPYPKGALATWAVTVHNRLGGVTTFSLSVLEADWSASLSTSSVTLLPGASQSVTLSVTVPPDGTTRAFNVVARTPDGAPYGGAFHRFDIF